MSEDPVSTFNVAIRAIFDIFAALPSSMVSKIGLRTLREEMQKGMNAVPSFAIQVFGKYILACKADIEAGTADRILKIDHAPYIIELSREYKFDVADAAKCIGHMKQAFLTASPTVRLSIVTNSRTLLASYIKYKIPVRSGEERKG